MGLMVYQGLTKYRNKKYALIGLVGILFSVGFTYIADNYKLKFPIPKVFREAMVQSEPMYLNNIVKEIEFYKMQHGIYPDSLKQLKVSGLTILNDPMLDDEKNDLFNYHKIDDKYTLFSSGVDGIPNTKDDIYPTVDTSKTGLIINKH